ncbi:MAG: Succinyl-CoA ligase (ADP-forming) subunit alpha [candidate division WS6 bacterium OLB20]|uniref:Succinyl-CoA ligase (ADP-forming) subunit alpha n=1 Tax=candidate division WS6 bacterium OLB20 TaxID=1617426 RepID=A0A136LXV0_9BACT|nr:MAG: Succinyl-CoA ligase (ADP-forming) subunit alpha [candidate division WS6 bacterium OLB20]
MSGLYAPESIAVIGASREPDKIGSVVLANILASGYSGRIFAVNPHADIIQGVDVYASVTRIPHPVSMAVVAVPARFVLEVLEECVMKGVKHAVVITAGFAETGEQGEQKELEIAALVKRSGIKITGPNCLGFINTEVPVDATFSQTSAHPGNIAYVSQSGAMGTSFLDWAQKNEIGLSHFVSVGNKVSVNENDLLREFGANPKVKTLLFYLEDFVNGQEFVYEARRITNDKPVVILKPGKSKGAQHAMASHTGSIAGDERIIDAALEDAGCIRVDTIEALFNITKLIAWQPLPKGNRVAVITNAGGVGIQTVDDLEAQGLHVIPFAEKLQKKLEVILPEEASTANPVDLLGDALAERYRQVLDIVIRDRSVDAVLVVLTPQRVTQSLLTAKYVNEIADAHNKPVVASFLGGESIRQAVDFLDREQIPQFSFPNDAAVVLGELVKWSTRVKEAKRKKPKLYMPAKVNKTLEAAAVGGTVPLAAAQDLFRSYDISLLESTVFESKKSLLAEKDNLPYPMVLKLVHPKLIHKTEFKAVRLGIKNELELENNARELDDIAKSQGWNGHAFELQPFVEDKLEIIIGVKKDMPVLKEYNGQTFVHNAGFGHVLLFGAGGIYTELYQDVALQLLPVTKKEALALISNTKIGSMISGYRGKRYDLEGVADVLTAVSKLIKFNTNITQLDINPLFVTRDKVYAADIKVFI